jgi:hypothetical protein
MNRKLKAIVVRAFESYKKKNEDEKIWSEVELVLEAFGDRGENVRGIAWGKYPAMHMVWMGEAEETDL